MLRPFVLLSDGTQLTTWVEQIWCWLLSTPAATVTAIAFLTRAQQKLLISLQHLHTLLYFVNCVKTSLCSASYVTLFAAAAAKRWPCSNRSIQGFSAVAYRHYLLYVCLIICWKVNKYDNDISCPPGPQQQTPRRDGTDRRTPYRHVDPAVYHASSVSKSQNINTVLCNCNGHV